MRISPSVRTMLLALVIAALPACSFAGVFVSISIAPPVLPVYTQPFCPAAGYLWTPGYWAYGPEGYYWVPGVWVEPPDVGLLWTPGYWGWDGGYYFWHTGYWGPHVGFYGGVHYGYGYNGVGFYGGAWRGGHFFYNTAVVHVNTTVIHNTYIDRTVIHERVNSSRASFNGPGGIQARPTAAEMQARQNRRFGPTANQTAHRETASQSRSQFYSQSHGHPAIAARSEVGGRAYDQQGRIAEGASHGQLNGRQVSRDENRPGRIENSNRNDREANGDHLTGQEQKNGNHRQKEANHKTEHQQREKGHAEHKQHEGGHGRR